MAGGKLGRPWAGPRRSDWVDFPAGGDGKAVVEVGVGAQGSLGVAAEEFEYRMWAGGANQSWPRIRFPGNYADAETGLNENWHRYYEARTGRYLETEPRFSSTTATESQALAGRVASAYGYATENPVQSVDSTGLDPVNGFPCALHPEVCATHMSDHEAKALLALVAAGAAVLVPEAVAAADGTLGAWLLRSLTARQTAALIAAAGAGVQENQKAGNAFRDLVAQAIRAKGNNATTEICKWTPFGKRFIDVEVSTPEGEVLGGIEAKLGDSAYIASQRAKDAWLWIMDGYRVNLIRGGR